jgi:large subunit ribosomal protein L35
LRKARRRRNLPLPVTLNRLAAALRVLSFGIGLGARTNKQSTTPGIPPPTPTRKAAAKRFKVTGSGKFLRRRAFRNHLLDHKSPKRKRYLGTMAVVDERDAENVSRMLPYA